MNVTRFFLIFFYFLSAHALNGRTTYQAKIIKPDGYPLESPNVHFRFSVLDYSGSCVLYIEEYTSVNMGSSGGLISFALGAGNRTFPASGVASIFQNVFDNSVPSFPCQAPGIYNPLPQDGRKIVMQFNDMNGWQTLPAMAINAVPYAMYASKASSAVSASTALRLNGKTDSAFVEYSTLAGLNCNPSTQAITFNGVNFNCVSVVDSSSGVSSVTTSGSVLITGGTASAPVISIAAASFSQDGYIKSFDYAEFKAKLSASSTQIMTTLGFAPVSAALVNSQINAALANETLSGDVSGSLTSNTVASVGGKTAAQIGAIADEILAATASATADTLVKRDSTGNILASDLSATTAKLNYVDLYKPSASFNIKLQAPTSLNTNYILNLPATSGTLGQVLSTDGSGNLSWINPSTGSITNVSGTAGEIISSGGSSPQVSLANAGTVGTYFKVTTDTKGRVISGVTTLVLSDLPNSVLNTTSNFSGDVSGLISNITVNRIQGVSVTITALTTNDVLQYDGVKYVNRNIPTCSGSQYLTFNGSSFGCVIDAGSSGTIASIGITAPLQSTGGSNPVLSMTPSSSSTSGYLSSADWNTFNDKISSSTAAVIQALGYTPAQASSATQWSTSGANIYYGAGNVGIGLIDPSHSLSVSGTAFFSGIATVSGVLTGAVVLPGGNVNPNPLIFRFDQNVLAYADKWATITTTPAFNSQKLFNINDGGINLYDLNSGGDVVIEVTGVSIGNTSHNNMWPFVAFHSNPTGNVRLELMSSSMVWETAYEGPTASYILKKYSMSAGGLRGARYTFSSMSPGTWLRTVGVIGRNSNPYQWVLKRDGGTVYGDINLLAKLGVGLSSPSARLQIASGSTSIAPLKINSGTLLSSAQAGAIEYDGVNFYLTDDTNSRRSIATVASPGTFDKANTISNSTGNITLSPNNTSGSVIVSATTASTNANTGALVVKGGVGVSGNLNVNGTMAVSNIATSIINGAADLSLNPNAGNVGVGVSSPTARLDVGGDINMANNAVLRSGGRQLLIMGLSGTTYLDSNGPGSGIRLQPNGNVAMTLTASGNVGIGTTNPDQNLVVSGVIKSTVSSLTSYDPNNMSISPSEADGLVIHNNGSSSNSTYASLILRNKSSNVGVGRIALTGGSATSALTFLLRPSTGAVSASEVMRITSTGNVGIGTSTPDASLVVSGTGSSGTGLLILRDYSSPTGSSNRGPHLFFDNADGEKGWIGFYDSSVHGSGVQMNLRSYTGPINLSAASTGNHLFIATSGNVGIGTTAPSEKLSVDGRAIFGPNAAWSESLVVGIEGSLAATGVQSATIGATNGNLHLEPKNGFDTYINHYTSGTRHVFMQTGNSSGRVGIGTISPSQKLHLVGDARIQGSVTDCYIGNGSGGTSCSSDEKLKDNIKPIPFALDKINSLRGVEFEWNTLSKSFGRKDIGVIAQDVEKVFPTAVSTGDDGYKKVDYAALVAPLIQAVKEIYNRLSEQDRKIASVNETKADWEEANSRILQLEKENKALKDYLCAKDPAAVVCK